MRHTTIEAINAKSHEELRFRELVGLKVPGRRDRFSALSADQKLEIETALPDTRARDTAARWVLRGLEVTRAIRKVKSDLEVADNAIGRRYGSDDDIAYALDRAKEAAQ